MNNKISNKLYGALLRFGTPPDIAANFAKETDRLGVSTSDTVERDNYEIMITAKALSSLISRHSAGTEKASGTLPITSDNSSLGSVNDTVVMNSISATLDNNNSSDMFTQINDSVTSRTESDDYPVTTKHKRPHKFWTALEKMPHWCRVTLSVVLPALMWLGMIVLTGIVIGLVGVCLLTMVAMTVSGIILFIVGLLYGVSQFATFTAAAYYEIGLGLICGGVTSLLIVLLYNILTILLPFLLKLGIKKLNGVNRGFRKFRADIRKKSASI